LPEGYMHIHQLFLNLNVYTKRVNYIMQECLPEHVSGVGSERKTEQSRLKIEWERSSVRASKKPWSGSRAWCRLIGRSNFTQR